MRRTPTADPAEVFERAFVPALFAQWGPRVAAAARIGRGDRVLDVGCGTGVLACAAAARVGDGGAVTGLDPNAQMLAVARRKGCRVDWRDGAAEALPFAEASFDAVVSQAAAMFFSPLPVAIAEMLRVLSPGGRLAVHVFDRLEHAPGYHVLTERLSVLFGPTVADAMRPPFALGDGEALAAAAAQAGAEDIAVATVPGAVHFDSLEAMIAAEHACVWTLGGVLDEAQFERLRHDAATALGRFIRRDGSVVFDCPARILTAGKPPLGAV